MRCKTTRQNEKRGAPQTVVPLIGNDVTLIRRRVHTKTDEFSAGSGNAARGEAGKAQLTTPRTRCADSEEHIDAYICVSCIRFAPNSFGI